MKVAIVHDYLVNRGGAERVALAMHKVWPDAPIFTSLYHPEATYDGFRDADVRPSPLQRHSSDPRAFRRLLPLFPRAFAQMDLSGYDAVISSSSGFAHHVRTHPGTCHIVYAYSPPRFLWDTRYGLAGVAPAWARPFIPPVRSWLRRLDKRAAARPHFYLAVSDVARRRIGSTYGRPATVLHPPVQVERFTPSPFGGDFHLLVGRLLPYRNQELAVRAFTQAERRLVIVGDGPSRPALEAIAGPTIEFRGAVPDDELVSLYARCRAVVVPGVEDFGLTPLEANASGRPAIALGAGGALETVRDGVTGVLFAEPTPEALASAIGRADAIRFRPRDLRAHAERWSEGAFATALEHFVSHAQASCIACARHRRGQPARMPAPAEFDAAAEEA